MAGAFGFDVIVLSKVGIMVNPAAVVFAETASGV
jgi:hypothetical protein